VATVWIVNCCEHNSVATPYFNKNFKEDWQNFLDAEWLDLSNTHRHEQCNQRIQANMTLPF